MHPWFATNYSCAVIQINCHRIASSGAELDMTQQLEGLERKVLTKIIFSHCPSLQIPAIVTEFSRLQLLETFNTSIRAWPLSSGALTHAKQPHLIQVHLVDTNVSSFPEGLMHHELPRDLSLLFYNINLTELPSDIGHTWGVKTWHYIRIEHGRLTTWPISLERAKVSRLSLIDNQIEVLPDDIFASQSFTGVRLSQNPLNKLPSSLSLLGDTNMLQFFMVDETNVSNLPVWFHDWYDKRSSRAPITVSLRGSPLCLDETLEASAFCQLVAPNDVGAFRYDLVLLFRRL